MRIILAAILLLALMAPVSAESVKEYPILRIGVIATRDIVSAEYTWGQTLEMLSKALPEHEFVMVELGADYQKAVRDGTVDFVIGNPGQYVELEAAYGASRIATVEFVGGPNPSQALGSTLFVKSGRSDIRALEDIRGHSLVAIAPELFGGFRLAWRELAQRGVDPFTDTSATRFVGEPVDRVFSAVSNGQADIGVVRSCLLERLASKGKIDASKFTVIEGWRPPNLPCQVSTPLYPDWPFAKLARTPNALAKQVALTLLAMPPDENGQSWTIPVDYQPVNDVFRALKIGPYEYLRQHSWSQVLTDYWQWLAAATLCFAWVLFSLARVQYLVQVRTQELKDANLQARREREKREHAARLSLMGEMASSLAHEISQPLAAIVNYARGCQRRIAGGRPMADIEPGVNQIVAQAERAAVLLHRMRDFVRKRPPTPTEINAGEILTDTLDLFAPVAQQRGVELQYVADTDLPRIHADRIQIEEVLLNLLQNAVDAVEGRAERRVLLSTTVADSVLTISVSDTGSGITPQAQERLFEAFFTTKPQGLGLGLSLSRSIVEAHGGRLSGENLPEGGALLSFSLPVVLESTRDK